MADSEEDGLLLGQEEEAEIDDGAASKAEVSDNVDATQDLDVDHTTTQD